jgi:SNF2 family DNA or RNA helicase
MLNRSNLHNYQNNIVQHIKTNNGAGVFAQMGLGKTASTLTALNDLINGFEVSKVLIVAPLTVAKSVWHNEAVEWEHLSHLSFSIVVGTLKERETALKKKADIYIINKENIPWLGEHYQSKFPFDMIVIDESSAFKNASSKRFKMLRKMINLDSVKRTVILTGTPAPNGYIDLWSQIFILDKGQRLGKNISMYRRSFFDSDFMGYKFEIKRGAKEDIDNRIKDIVISLQAKDYLEMPDFIPSVINIAMSPKLSKLYYDFEQDMIYNLQELKADDTKVLAQSAATLTNKLLQFSSGSLYNDLGEVENVHDLKFEALDEIIENNPNEQILVFYNFKFEKEKLAKRYKDLHFMDKAMENVKLWNDKKIKLLALHPASAGHGLNLQKSGASLSVWLGFQWSLELYQQANGRLYRQGQKNHVRCIHLAVGDIEYRLLRALAKKENVQQALMDALKGE